MATTQTRGHPEPRLEAGQEGKATGLWLDSRGRVVHLDEPIPPFVPSRPEVFPRSLGDVLHADLVPVVQALLQDALAGADAVCRPAKVEDDPRAVRLTARAVRPTESAAPLVHLLLEARGGDRDVGFGEPLHGAPEHHQTADALACGLERLRRFIAEESDRYDALQHLNEDLQRITRRLVQVLDEREVLNRDFHQILTGLHIAVLFLDADLRVRRCSPLAEALFHANAGARKPLVGQSVADLQYALTYEDLPEDVRGVLSDGLPRRREVAAKTGRWYQVLVHPGAVENGAVTEVLVALLDITERKQIEAEYRSSEERWRRLVQMHPEPILLTVDGVIVFTNQAGARVFGGASEDDIIGRSVFDFIVPELHDVFRRRLRRLQRGRPTEPYEHQLIRLDGVRRDVIAASIPVTYQGRPAAQTVIRDITHRKQVERELREERNFITAVLDTIDALVVVLDREGRIVRMNQACETFSGYAEAEVLGEDLVERFVPPVWQEQARRYLADLRDAGIRQHRTEHPWQTRSGEVRLVAWSTTTLPDESGQTRFIIGTGLDITEQRRLEQAVLHLTEEERRRFGRDLHDGLGSQLTGIALLTRSVIQDLLAGQQVRVEDLEEINRLVVQSAEMARALAQGLNPVQLEEEGLVAALQSLVEGIGKLADTEGVFESRVCQVSLDVNTATQLYWIVQEAVGNAMKHARASRIRVRLWEEREAAPPRLHLRIEDDGIGFDLKQAEAAGMGLHTMRYRARLIGARLHIVSRPGRGTRLTCSVEIPGVYGGLVPVPAATTEDHR